MSASHCANPAAHSTRPSGEPKQWQERSRRATNRLAVSDGARPSRFCERQQLPESHPEACCNSCRRWFDRDAQKGRERKSDLENRRRSSSFAPDLRHAVWLSRQRSKVHGGATQTRRPGITLKHYQKAIPASVKPAAIALENEPHQHEFRAGFERVRYSVDFRMWCAQSDSNTRPSGS